MFQTCDFLAEPTTVYSENTVQDAYINGSRNRVVKREQPGRCCLVSKKREQPGSDPARERRKPVRCYL
jgi:hypothetical protein